jgi:methionyl-tRNA formyltransferase
MPRPSRICHTIDSVLESLIMSGQTRIIFMGTPEFALPTLQALIAHFHVVGVVTQPDRPAGRGRAIQPPPVKPLAVAHNLPVYQPKTLRRDEAVAQLASWAPDLIVTAAIGLILPPEVLNLPARGTLNVHASLLPRWRGAAPIQAAILAGDDQTGVTIMWTEEGLDTGPILSQRAIPIAPRETAASLHDKLAPLGAQLLIDTLPAYLDGTLEPQPQPAEGVTIAQRIRKEDGRVDWERPAAAIDRQVRAFTPWPGAFSFWEGRRLKILETFPSPTSVPLEQGEIPSPPGTVVQTNGHPAVVTGDGLLRLDQLQMAGRRATSGGEFLHGHADFIGARLGDG